MINALRKKSDSFVAKTAFSILAVTFVAGGVGTAVIGSQDITALTVNGEKVSIQEIQREYMADIRNLQRNLGSEPSQELLEAVALGNRTVNNIVRDYTLTSKAKDLGLRANDAHILSLIKNSDSFKNADGEFDRDIYRSVLQSNGITAEGYESSLRENVELAQLANIFQAHNIDETYANDLLTYANETVDVKYIVVTKDMLGKVKQPTTEEITKFYNENAHKYLTDEARDYVVISIDLDAVAQSVTVSEEDARAEYDAHPESYATPEKREVSHILVSSKEKADALLEQLNNGADFATLAKAESQDAFTKAKGGKIGFIAEGEMVPSFTDVAFATEVGNLSTPVETDFGWHIIKVTGTQEAKELTFDEVKGDITAELTAIAKEDAYYALLEQVDDLAASGSALTEIAKELSLDVKTVKATTLNNFDDSHAAGLKSTVFALEQNVVSEPISTSNGTKTMYVEVTNITESREKTLEEAQAEIKATLTDVAEQKALSAKASGLLESAKASDLAKTARKAGLSRSVKTVENINRNGENAPEWMKPYQVNSLFRAQPNTVVSSLLNTADGLAVMQVTKRETTDVTEQQTAQFNAILKNQIAQDLYSQFASKSIQDADVKTNATALQSIMGTSYKAAK